MNKKYSESQKESWNTDAYNTKPKVIHNIIFCNEIINDYLFNKSKYFIVAGKGTGKTILLKYKRFLIEKSGESLLIPKDTPCLDFISDVGTLSDKLKEAYFHDYKNSKKIWIISLMISALSCYSHCVFRLVISSYPRLLKKIYRPPEKYPARNESCIKHQPNHLLTPCWLLRPSFFLLWKSSYPKSCCR